MALEIRVLRVDGESVLKNVAPGVFDDAIAAQAEDWRNHRA